MELPTDVPIVVLQARAEAAERYSVPLRLLLGVAWVESRFISENPAQAADRAARKLAAFKIPYQSWERALAARRFGEKIAQLERWPAHVWAYVREVNAAGQAARVPFCGPVWQIPLGKVG